MPPPRGHNLRPWVVKFVPLGRHCVGVALSDLFLFQSSVARYCSVDLVRYILYISFLNILHTNNLRQKTDEWADSALFDLWLQRIGGFTTMRYINLYFTYFYLLIHYPHRTGKYHKVAKRPCPPFRTCAVRASGCVTSNSNERESYGLRRIILIVTSGAI